MDFADWAASGSGKSFPDVSGGQRPDVRVFTSRRVLLSPGKWEHNLSDSHWRLYQHDNPGAVIQASSGEIYIMEPQRVYLIPPGRNLSTHCKAACNQFYLHFDLMGFPPLALADLFSGPVSIPESPAFSLSVSELGNACASGDLRTDLASEYWMRGIVCEALGRYLISVPLERREAYRQRMTALRPVLPALALIEERLGDYRFLSNTELAAACSISEDHFIHRFAAAAGIPPARYVSERRVARAAQLLLFSDHTLEQIAEMTGFRDRFYFSRVFTRETGRPPAAFRRGGRA